MALSATFPTRRCRRRPPGARAPPTTLSHPARGIGEPGGRGLVGQVMGPQGRGPDGIAPVDQPFLLRVVEPRERGWGPRQFHRFVVRARKWESQARAGSGVITDVGTDAPVGSGPET